MATTREEGEVLSASGVETGPPILPHQRIQLMSADDWEAFVNEWADSLRPDQYQRVERHSGAGDMGIDVCGYVHGEDLFSPWDNFQCKQYGSPLSPSNAWVEIGKLIYYTWLGKYTVPRRYYFCASRDVGSKLAKLLRRPRDLKNDLKEAWDKHCKDQISNQPIPLEGELLEYFEQFDFTIFSYKPIAELISQHRKTPYFVARFGGGLRERPEPEAPPAEIASHETVYTNALLSAYADHLGLPSVARNTLNRQDLLRHFERSRREFYCAEGLRVFSFDNLDPKEYARLGDLIYHAVQDALDDAHADGYARVRAVVRHAQYLQIDAHPLKNRMNPTDRAGICHQLANDSRMEWVRR